MLSWVMHEMKFITLGPDLIFQTKILIFYLFLEENMLYVEK